MDSTASLRLFAFELPVQYLNGFNAWHAIDVGVPSPERPSELISNLLTGQRSGGNAGPKIEHKGRVAGLCEWTARCLFPARPFPS